MKVLSPRWIVHTGDLADDVKLELSPAELPRYRSKLENLSVPWKEMIHRPGHRNRKS